MKVLILVHLKRSVLTGYLASALDHSCDACWILLEHLLAKVHSKLLQEQKSDRANVKAQISVLGKVDCTLLKQL